MGTLSSKAVPIAIAAMFALVLAVGLCAVALGMVIVAGYGGGVASFLVPFAFIAVFCVAWWLLRKRQRASEEEA